MPVNLVATPANELFPVPGVRWGIAEAGIRKAGRKDLSVLLLDEGSVVGGVFTQNRFCAAPVQICRENLALNSGATHGIRAMVINTGNANAGTGADGLMRARHLHRTGPATQFVARADPAFFDRRHHGAAAARSRRRRPAGCIGGRASRPLGSRCRGHHDH